MAALLGGANPGDDGAGGRPDGTSPALAAQVEGTGAAAGQADGAGDAMVVGRGMQRADDGQSVGQGRRLGKQLAEAKSGDAGGDGREGTAELQRSRRLGVPGVQLRRSSPQPEKD